MFLQELRLGGILSFKEIRFPLKKLNVLIGPNGAGKSNLIEAIGLLRACAGNLGAYLLQGGGAQSWIWNGDRGSAAEVQATFVLDRFQLDYDLQFLAVQSSVQVQSEHLVRRVADSEPQIMFTRTADRVEFPGGLSRLSPASGPPPEQTFLSRHRMESDPTSITNLARKLESIRIYRDFATRKSEVLRQGAGGLQDGFHLDELGLNLPLVLHELYQKDKLDALDGFLGDLGTGFRRIKARFLNGLWTIQLAEDGLLDPVPAPRISDGTLRFLCILAILLDPDPPPLVCIEEPEVGLHPDALQLVARAMLGASERMQLVVTTHSDHLVSALESVPDAIVVCEKDEGNATRLRRLEPEALDGWLDDYRLGELWRKGEIGGNRW